MQFPEMYYIAHNLSILSATPTLKGNPGPGSTTNCNLYIAADIKNCGSSKGSHSIALADCRATDPLGDPGIAPRRSIPPSASFPPRRTCSDLIEARVYACVDRERRAELMVKRLKLGEKILREAEPVAGKSHQIFDTEILGLAVRVQASGTRAFTIDYRYAGRQRRMTIGRWPEWSVAEASRRDHPKPPDGPKALDRAMQRAAQRLKQTGAPVAVRGSATGNGKTRRRKRDDGPRHSDDELAAFYADLVNSDRFLPPSTISNTMRDAMLARGLVTPERLRARGVR